MRSFALAATLLVAVVMLTAMTNLQAQIIIGSEGSCLENNPNKTCGGYNYFVEDCYCDLECLTYDDCCEDFFQLDYCQRVSGSECESGSVRLVPGGTLEGFVQVCIFRTWRAVCSETFDQKAAQVTCQSLGYNATEDSLNFASELPIEPFAESFYPSCQSGMESQLTECLIQQNKQQNCSQPASVRCFTDGTVDDCDMLNCVNGVCTTDGCVCHDGWNGTRCTDFICSPDCVNGECVGPHTCSCQDEWTGPRCRVDVNECNGTDNGGCDHFCNNIDGGYYCSCLSGYRLSSTNKKSCKDIDECLEGSHSCEVDRGFVSCINTNGSYYCECHEGYEFAPDGQMLACVEIDECLTALCDQNCTDKLNSYICSCQDGYMLEADGHSCVDMDECARGSHNCNPRTEKCKNLIGSFYCDCTDGYDKPNPDSPCEDVNECLVHNGGCSDGCNNIDGGFDCYCPKGYELMSDKKTCKDVDECSSTLNTCTGPHVSCVNEPGSFHCECEDGYDLNMDNITCSAQQCYVTLDNPENGVLVCPTGQTINSNCSTTCDAGYEIVGEPVLTCLSSRTWSDQPPSCQLLQCGQPNSVIPSNGFIELPCSNSYNSSCSIGCFAGFSLNGSGEISCQLSGTDDVEWTSDGAYCQKVGPCTPNPCSHGECIVLDDDEFMCNCTNTFHTGDRCQDGIILLDVPVLQVQTGPRTIPVLAYVTIVPDENVMVTVTVKAGGFTPTPGLGSVSEPLGMSPKLGLKFSSGNTRQSFPLFPNEAGRYSLHFTIKVTSTGGEIRSNYPETLEYPVLVIDPLSELNYFKVFNNQTHLLVPSVCGELRLASTFCPSSAENREVSLLSSCGWNKTATKGIVFAHSSASNISFPLSAIGVRADKGKSDIYKEVGDILCSPCSTDQRIIETLPTDYGFGSAYPYMYASSVADSSEFVRRDSLALTFLHTLQQSLLPPWLDISIPDVSSTEVTFSDSDLINNVSSKVSVRSMEECQLQTLTDAGRYIVLKHDGKVEFTAQNNGEHDSSILPAVTEAQEHLHCFAVSLCDSHPAVHVGLSEEASQALTKANFFETLSANGWQVEIDSLSFKKATQALPPTKTYWNGITEDYLLPVFQPDVTMKGFIKGVVSNHGTSVEVEIEGLIDYEYAVNSAEVNVAVGTGSGSLLLETVIHGTDQTLFLDKDLTDGFLYFTGMPSTCSSIDQPGIALSLAYQPQARHSDFFLGLFHLAPDAMSCEVDAFVNLNQHKQMNGVSFQSSCLGLSYDSLFFPSMNVRTLISMDKDTHCLSNQGLYTHLSESELGMEIHASIESPLSLGRFRLRPTGSESHALSIGFSKNSHHKAAYMKEMEVSLFNSFFTTSVQIVNNILSFSGKLFIASFPANIQCTADTSNDWHSLTLEVTGLFDEKGADSFPKRIEKAVQTKITSTADTAKSRLNQADMDLNRIAQKVDNITSELHQVEQELQDIREEYNQARKLVDEAMSSVQDYQEQVDNATGRVQLAREAVDMLCEIEECELVCQPTVESKIEYKDEFIAINSTCYVLENKTEEIRVPPFYMQKVTWGFAEVCEGTVYSCTDIDNCQRYPICPVISLPMIALCPAPDNRINVTVEYLRPTTCVERVFNRTVEKLVSNTNPCGQMVADVACLHRTHECQIIHDRAFQVLEEEEEGLTQPLQQLNQAKNKLSIAQNDQTRLTLEINSLNSEKDFLKLLLNSAQTQSDSLNNNYDKLLESIAPGLMLSKLLDDHEIDEVFAITNITFNSTVHAGDPDNQLLQLVIRIATVNDSDLSLRYDMNLSHSATVTLVNNLASFIFESTFEVEPRQRRSLPGKRHKRQSPPNIGDPSSPDIGEQPPPNIEVQFLLQCADLNNALSYLLHLQSTLEDEHTYTSGLLEEIEELLRDIGASDLNATHSLPPANYTLIENAFNVTMKDVEDNSTIPPNNDALDARENVTDEIKSQAEDMKKNVEQDVQAQWKNNMEALHEESGSVAGHECFGFSDCLLVVSDMLQSLLVSAPSSQTEVVLPNMVHAIMELRELTMNDSLTPSQALANLTAMLTIAQTMVDMGYWCASPPQFILQPELVVNVSQGETLTLKCQANSTILLSYTWNKEGIPLNDSNSTVLTVENMQVANEGNYTCQAQNDVGSVTSRRSMVQVYTLPVLTVHPVSVTTFVGDENGARFTCNGTGRPTPGWLWQFRRTHEEEWSDVPGNQTNLLWLRQPVRDEEGQYRCIAYNWHGNATSEPADLKLLDSTIRVATIPVNLRLSRVADPAEDKRRKRNADSIEEQVLNQLNDIFELGGVTIQGFSISTSDDGEQLFIRFTLVGANVTSEAGSMALVEDVQPLINEAQEEVVQLKEELEEYFLTESFVLEYNGSVFNNSDDSITIETTTIVCPPGQQLHKDWMHCVDCLAGEHAVSMREVHYSENGEVRVEQVPRCTPCPTNTYQEHEGGGECQSCPSNHITLEEGSTSMDDCIGYCAPNHYSPNGLVPCLSCEKTVNYQPEFGETSCIPCRSEKDDPFCDKGPLDVFLSGGSPIVAGDSATFVVNVNKPVYKLRCKISKTKYRDCSAGQVTFTDLQWRNKNKYYVFRADAITMEGEQFTLKRKFLPEVSGHCTVHLINRGVAVHGNNVTVEFATTGPVSSLNCILDGHNIHHCLSPAVFSDLKPGGHQLKIDPLGCSGKKNKYPLSLTFITN